MHKLFHITRGKNIESILQQGLRPASSVGFISKYDQKKQQKEFGSIVWLTDDVNYIIEAQTGWNWIEKHNAHVVIVNVSPYKQVLAARIVWCYDIPKVSEHEFYIHGPIESKDIIAIKPCKEFVT